MIYVSEKSIEKEKIEIPEHLKHVVGILPEEQIKLLAKLSVPKKAELGWARVKTAVARAVVTPGKGIVRINGRRLEAIENPWVRMIIEEPLILIGPLRYLVNINVKVEGGGVVGRARAVRSAIAKALVKFFESETLKKIFRAYDRYLLVDDPRMKEPKKFGGPGARARFQTSYR